MIENIQKALGLLQHTSLIDAGVLPWAAPVISFGNYSHARIATLGINPSDREFVDVKGKEIHGTLRRFPTLASLGLQSWGEANDQDIATIATSCEHYFKNNPYRAWFDVLDALFSDTHHSYYFPYHNICHLDLIPFATSPKWNSLSGHQQNLLLSSSNSILADVLNSSDISVLILNGKRVVQQLQSLSDSKFELERVPSWDLSRNNGTVVQGELFSGTITSLGPSALKSPIRVVGFNHNLQSSYGISKAVLTSIKDRITKQITSNASY